MEAINSKPPQTDAPKKVVVIEDDPVWQKIIHHCILNIVRNADVKIVSSAAEFRATVGDIDHLDLIISDQCLGEGQSGLEIWQGMQVRKSKTPFLLTSSVGHHQFLELLNTEKSAPGFVEKSLTGGTLIGRIRGLLKAEPLEVSPVPPIAAPKVVALDEPHFTLTLRSGEKKPDCVYHGLSLDEDFENEMTYAFLQILEVTPPKTKLDLRVERLESGFQFQLRLDYEGGAIFDTSLRQDPEEALRQLLTKIYLKIGQWHNDQLLEARRSS